MGEKEQKMAQYKTQAASQLGDCGCTNINHDRLNAHCDRMNPVILNQDATLVAAKDDAELETVHRNFVVKHLGIEDHGRSMSAIRGVAEKMSGINFKNRAAFYYMVEDELS